MDKTLRRGVALSALSLSVLLAFTACNDGKTGSSSKGDTTTKVTTVKETEVKTDVTTVITTDVTTAK